jgi:hypothetical protein
MGSQLEFNVGVAKFRIALSDFLKATKTLANAATKEGELRDVRSKLKELIQEVRKNFDLVVDAVTPLIALDTQQKFNEKFGDIRADFQNVVWKKLGDEGTSCTIVIEKMAALNKHRAWMQNVPIARRAFDRLNKLCNDWIAVDVVLDANIADFRDRLRDLLKEVAQLKRDDPEGAFESLETVVDSLDTDFEGMKKYLNELELVSTKL